MSILPTTTAVVVGHVFYDIFNLLQAHFQCECVDILQFILLPMVKHQLSYFNPWTASCIFLLTNAWL